MSALQACEETSDFLVKRQRWMAGEQSRVHPRRKHAILACHHPLVSILEAFAQASEVLVGQVDALTHSPQVVFRGVKIAADSVQLGACQVESPTCGVQMHRRLLVLCLEGINLIHGL